MVPPTGLRFGRLRRVFRRVAQMAMAGCVGRAGAAEGVTLGCDGVALCRCDLLNAGTHRRCAFAIDDSRLVLVLHLASNGPITRRVVSRRSLPVVRRIAVPRGVPR